MTDESDAVPPPYTSEDPFRTLNPQNDVTVFRTLVPHLNAFNRGIPSYEHAVGEDEALSFTSAMQYFEEHTPSTRRPRSDTIRHTIHLNPQSKATDVAFLPMCWQTASTYITEADMSTFANYLFPSSSRISVRDKYCEEVEGNTEPWYRRRARLENTVAEWNEGFFGPRSLHINLIHEDDIRTQYSPADVGCAECAVAYQMALEDLPKREDSTQRIKATRTADHPATLAWNSASSGRCPPGHIAGVATQSMSDHSEHRARHSNNSCHSRRQNHGCGSRRRHCSQKTSEVGFSKTRCSFKAPTTRATRTTMNPQFPNAYLPIVDPTIKLAAGMQVLALADPTTTKYHPVTHSLRETDPNQNPNTNFPLPHIPRRTREEVKNELRSLKEVKSDLKSLKHELKASMKQAKAERREERKFLRQEMKTERKALKQDIKAARKKDY